MDGWQVYAVNSRKCVDVRQVYAANCRLQRDGFRIDLAFSFYLADDLYLSLIVVPASLGCNRDAFCDLLQSLNCAAFSYRLCAACAEDPCKYLYDVTPFIEEMI